MGSGVQVTLLRAPLVLADLAVFHRRDRPGVDDERRTQRVRDDYQRLEKILQPRTGHTTDKDEVKFEMGVSADLCNAQRRLQLAKLFNRRLGEEGLFFDLPEEVLLGIAAVNTRACLIVPGTLYSTVDEALAAAPPDALIQLKPGLHRLDLGRLRPEQELLGLGDRPGDVIVVPQSNPAGPSATPTIVQHQAMMRNLAFVRANLHQTQPTAVLIFEDPKDTKLPEQWRSVVWQHVALLLLDLPFPIMMLLCVWRLPELLATLCREKKLHDRRCRTVWAFQTWLKVLLDIPAFIAIAIMFASAFRVPALLRAWRNRPVGLWSFHLSTARQFGMWLTDLPFVAAALGSLPFPWRSMQMLSAVWNAARDIEPDRADLFASVVEPTQRMLALRCFGLVVLDLIAVLLSPLLIVLPYRFPQLLQLFRHEKMCSRVLRRVHPKFEYHRPPGAVTGVQPFEFAQFPGAGDDRRCVSSLRRLFCTEDDHRLLLLGRYAKSFILDVEGHRTEVSVTQPDPITAADTCQLKDVSWHVSCECLLFAVLWSELRALLDLFNMLIVLVVTVLGTRHLPDLVRGWKGVISNFRGQSVALTPTAFEQYTFTGGWTGIDHSPHWDPATRRVTYRHGDRELLSFAPRMSSSMFYAATWQAFWRTVQDLPHLLVLPFKIAGVMLCPVYFYLCWRFGMHARQQETGVGIVDVAPGSQPPPVLEIGGVIEEEDDVVKQPNLSIFLQPMDKLVERAIRARGFRMMHERGLILLLLTPLCVLDVLGVLLATATVAVFAVPLSFFQPLWNMRRKTVGWVSIGTLPLIEQASWWYRTLQSVLVLLQVIGVPFLLLWHAAMALAPVLLWTWSTGYQLQPLLTGMLWWDDSSGSAGSNGGLEAIWPWQTAWWIVTILTAVTVCWVAVVLSSILLARTFCRRHVPLFSPLDAIKTAFTSVFKGRIWLGYRKALVYAARWCYSLRSSKSLWLGEVLIPLAVAVWTLWPLAAVLLPAMLRSPEDGGGDLLHSPPWPVVVGVGPAVLATAVLVRQCLRILNKHWRIPLSAEERKLLATPQLSCNTELPATLECPADGYGVILRLPVTKPAAFTAKRLQLELVGETLWDDLAAIVGAKVVASGAMIVGALEGTFVLGRRA